MFEKQTIRVIQKEELLAEVRQMVETGYRLVQIGCTPLADFQLDYSFDRDGKFVDLRVMLPREKAVFPSITGIYLCAFTYENELHDLFGIAVTGLAIDYGGNFYRTEGKPPIPPPVIKKDDQKPSIATIDKNDETRMSNDERMTKS